MLENSVAQRMQIECARLGVLIQRNNVGAGKVIGENGAESRFLRWGLMNESPELNKIVKSSDYIGITRVTITPDMVGQTVGVYTALETKASDWHRTPGDKRAEAQAAYHDIVRAHGGFAGFVTSDEDLHRIIRGER